MKREYCLDIDGNVYTLGDLNMFLNNKEPISYPAVDSQNPTKPFFTGSIRQEVEIDGIARSFLLYIPQHYPISGAGIFLYPDDDVSAEDYLENSGWKPVAEQTNAALIVLESRSGGWDRKDIQSEISYSEAVFKKSIARVYFSMNEATYYCMGFGNGAYVAATYAMLNSALFAAIALDGDYDLHPDLMAQLRTIRSDREANKSKLDVAMPAWLIGKATPLLDSLKRAADASDEQLYNDAAYIYRQNLKQYFDQPNGLPMVEIWHTEPGRWNPEADEKYRRMAEFVLRFKRWLSIGNGDFRPARTWQDMRLHRFTAEIDNRQREWFVYEPTALRAGKLLPLVLAIHGYSCTGELFAENSSWHELAERRGFLLVYVSAFPDNGISGGHTVPLPSWNALNIHAQTDDVKYIDYVLSSVKNSYPVDSERVYVSGHSNGSLLTQRLMEERPLAFAAFGPQGAPYHMGLDGTAVDRTICKDGIIRPVWLMMGAEDIGDQDKLDCGSINDRFLDMMCELNDLDRTGGIDRENGKYHTRTFVNAERVPLVKFTGITDTPHTYTPEFAQLYWDTFFCHFRRKSDGTIIYTD